MVALSEGGEYCARSSLLDGGCTPAGNAFLQMLGVFAEFETNIRRERQMEGIAKAKAKGIYKGRKPTIDAAEVAKLQAEGISATEIAKCLGIGRASVYRVLRDRRA